MNMPAAPKIVMRDPAKLIPDARNARTHSDEQIAQLRASMDEFGFTNPVLLRDDAGNIGAGHGRRAAALLEPALGAVPCIIISGLSESQWRALAIADNQLALNAGWDLEILKGELEGLAAEGFDISLLGFDDDWMDDILNPSGPGEPASQSGLGSLSERFMAVPFSVLNAREGWWQERKGQWLELGIESEIGREDNLLGMSATVLGQNGGSGTSIFDPVLAELAYRWYSPEGGRVLDPFAGGSVRGIVAAKLGREYVGIDLRSEQVEANEGQAERILGERDGKAVWIEGDSRAILGAEGLPAGADADFIFSCPPYGPLEVYSKLPEDLSNMAAKEFRAAYRAIIHGACERLADDRFAAFVVGDYRDGKGILQDFISETISAFHAAGAKLYNHAILVTAVGNLAMRAGRTFAASRKLGGTHQHLLIFVKGDWKRACKALGSVEIDAEALDALEAGDEAGGDALDSLGGMSFGEV